MRKFAVPMFAASAMFFAFSTPALAGRPLPVEELRSLLTGKTVHAYSHKQEQLFVIYFAPDGVSYHTDKKGNPYTGKWWIDDKANHCVESRYFSGCYPIHDNDGIYQKMDGDVALYTIKKIEDGTAR